MAIGAAVRFPQDVHVVTCLPCGFREPTNAGDAYAERCPYCGRPVEHFNTRVDERAELNAIATRPRMRLLAAMAGDLRTATRG